MDQGVFLQQGEGGFQNCEFLARGTISDTGCMSMGFCFKQIGDGECNWCNQNMDNHLQHNAIKHIGWDTFQIEILSKCY